MKILVSKEWLFEQYVTKKRSGNDIGKELKVVGSTVRYWLKVYNIPLIQKYQRLQVPKDLTLYQKEIIIGSLFGDGCIAKPPQGYCYYTFSQCVDHAAYVRWMKNQLKEWAAFQKGQDVGICSTTFTLQGKTKTTKQAVFRTVSHPIFSELESLFYEKRIKVVREEVLKQLTPQGIAVLYMDDGSFTGGHIRLSLESFTEIEKESFCKFFQDTYGIKFVLLKYKHNELKREYVCIRTNKKEETKKFLTLVEPYIKVPCMKYKILGTSETICPTSNDEDIVRSV